MCSSAGTKPFTIYLGILALAWGFFSAKFAIKEHKSNLNGFVLSNTKGFDQ